MGRCAKCQFDHEGTGQSPEHPVEISSGVVLFWGIVLIVSITVLILVGGR